VIKTVGRAAGLYGVRRQAKRDAALACVYVVSISKPASSQKRRRASLASLAAALHMIVTDTSNRARPLDEAWRLLDF